MKKSSYAVASTRSATDHGSAAKPPASGRSGEKARRVNAQTYAPIARELYNRTRLNWRHRGVEG